MVWQPSFTRALLGGLLIGGSASLLLATVGRVAGWSGVVGGLVRPRVGEVGWRALFLAGLLLGGVLSLLYVNAPFPAAQETSLRGLALLFGAGLLVGYGTRLGGGCTSGHGVCGIARGSARSIVATVTFIMAGMIAVFAMRVVAGGLP